MTPEAPTVPITPITPVAPRRITATMWRGAVAGLAGGVVFGVATAELGSLPTVAALVRADSPVVGFAVHLVIAVVLGALFGLLVREQATGSGETVFWGLAYGMVWWYLGALTLLPALLGERLGWSVDAARAAFPSLVGHLLYGAVAGLVLSWLRPRAPRARVTAGVLVRGSVAGLAPVALLTAVGGERYSPLAVSSSMMQRPWATVTLAVLILGLLAGIGFAVLYPRAPEVAGPSLLRGAGYGFLLWLVLGLTVVPLIERGALAWSIADVREVFPTLPAYLVLGTAVAAGFGWLDRAWRLLFTPPVRRADDEGPGARTLRAVGRGVLAGVVGGLLFTGVMARIGFFGTVARLVGGGSVAVGVLVHLVISVIIGAWYGLLFRRQTPDMAAALGWGTAYGFLWWVLGGVTLLPLFLGADVAWSAEQVAAAFPSLVGHLAYGAGLGVTFALLEARYDPWWVPRGAVQAARVARHRAALETSAPAVWVLVVLLAFTVTVTAG